ncbi:sugar ABC transporter ATP-binding protein [Gordonia sp. NPDC003950]
MSSSHPHPDPVVPASARNVPASAPAVPALALDGIAKRFGNAVALEQVSIEFAAGTVTALTGENGSGKSTVAKIIGGLVAPDRGQVLIDGKPVRITDASVARQHGIALISQELTLATDLTVAENIFMGALPRRGVGVVAWRTMRSRAREILEMCGTAVDPRAAVADLSIEMAQQVEIARALAAQPRILILDEATSSLSEKAAQRLLELVEDRRAEGVAVVMITHRMNEIFRTADTAAVLRDGRIMAAHPIAETTEKELVQLMVGRELGDYYGTRSPQSKPGSVVLAANGISTPTGELAQIDLTVRAGEIVGVAGLSGSGKESLGHVLGGAVTGVGDLRVNEKPIPLGRPDKTLAGGIGFVPEDRKAMGLLLQRSVADNFILAWGERVFRHGVRRLGIQRRSVGDAISRFDVRTTSASAPVAQLSGGNQQKIIIGRLFDLGLPVYVMSEPTRGIDVGAKSAIYALLREQVEQGAAVVLISSELNELCGMSDRVITLYAGEVVAEFVEADITEENITAAMVAGKAGLHHIVTESPQPAVLSQ